MDVTVETRELDDRVAGCVLGTALGDALGLPYEGLSPRRAEHLLGPPDRFRLLAGRGMVSDDTEHTCLALQALAECAGDPARYERLLAGKLRGWLATVPAGVGLATARAIGKLWLGYPPTRSGVYSAGNGPAMRSAILGAALADPQVLPAFVQANTRLTHTDPKAEYGALAIAVAAWSSRRATAADWPRLTVAELDRHLPAGLPAADELRLLLGQVCASVAAGQDTRDFAHALMTGAGEKPPGRKQNALGLGQGVTGYVYHTVPVALQAAFRHADDYLAATAAVIRCGGDADTTAAIVGGLVGTRLGTKGFFPFAGQISGCSGHHGLPNRLLAKLVDWPRSVSWMTALSHYAAARLRGEAARPPRLAAWALPLRNIVFLAVVLAHGVRRLLPPY